MNMQGMYKTLVLCVYIGWKWSIKLSVQNKEASYMNKQ